MSDCASGDHISQQRLSTRRVSDDDVPIYRGCANFTPTPLKIGLLATNVGTGARNGTEYWSSSCGMILANFELNDFLSYNPFSLHDEDVDHGLTYRASPPGSTSLLRH